MTALVLKVRDGASELPGMFALAYVIPLFY